MNCNPNLWYVKWFFWNLSVLDAFCRSNSTNYYDPSWEKYQNGTNLCHFFRTFALGTLISGFSLFMYLYVFFVVFILPFILFPIHGIALAGLMIISGFVFICVAVALITAVSLGSKRLYEELKEWSYERKGNDPGFFTLMIKYIVSIKQQFCPTISFKKEK